MGNCFELIMFILLIKIHSSVFLFVQCLPQGSEDIIQQRKILYMGLYLLEAAKLASCQNAYAIYFPQCIHSYFLHFTFLLVSFYLIISIMGHLPVYVQMAGNVSIVTGEKNIKPSSGGDDED